VPAEVAAQRLLHHPLPPASGYHSLGYRQLRAGADWKPAIPGDAHVLLTVYYTRMEMMPPILGLRPV